MIICLVTQVSERQGAVMHYIYPAVQRKWGAVLTKKPTTGCRICSQGRNWERKILKDWLDTWIAIFYTHCAYNANIQLIKHLLQSIFTFLVISGPVSEKMVPEKSLGAGIGKFWYRKKSPNRYRKKFGTETSTGISIENIFEEHRQKHWRRWFFKNITSLRKKYGVLRDVFGFRNCPASLSAAVSFADEGQCRPIEQ